MSALIRLLPDNPVLIKELRTRMRGARAYWILFGYLGFLSFVLLGIYGAFVTHLGAEGIGSSEVSVIGNQIFSALVVTQMFLVLFITPAITSGSVTIEKEQRTLDMLTMTRMARGSIISGKLLAAVSFTSLLLISSLPLTSICFMLGGLDPGMVLTTYLELLFGSFLIGAMGLMWSSIAKTTTMAVLFTYATLFVIVVFGYISYATIITPFRTGGVFFTAIQSALLWPLFGPKFLGLQVISGLGFAILCTISGILLAAVAMSRLEMFPERRARLLRGLTALLIGVYTLSADQWWLESWYQRSAQVTMRVAQPPPGALMVSVLLMMFVTPIFATGELSPYETRHYGRHLRWGWTSRGLARGKLASGLPYLLLLTLLCLTTYAFSFVLAHKPGDILHSATSVGASQPPAPVTGSFNIPGVGLLANGASAPSRSPLPSGSAQSNGDFTQIGILLLAFVTGFSLLCLLLSMLTRSRWSAWILAYVFLIAFVWIAPAQGRTAVDNGAAPGPTVSLYYLNPAQAIYQIASPNDFRAINHKLPMVDQPMWLRTTEVWLAIGSLCLLLTLPIAARERRRGDDVPYEEQIAEA